MPVLEVMDQDGALLHWADLEILATMHQPRNDQARQRLRVAMKFNRVAWMEERITTHPDLGPEERQERLRDLGPFMHDLFKEHGGLKAILKGPSLQKAMEDKSKSIVFGLSAGHILYHICLMKAYGLKPSVLKAVFVERVFLEGLLKDGIRGPKQKRFTDEGYLKTAVWAEYMPVAHLWAALHVAGDCFRRPVTPVKIRNFLSEAKWFQREGLSIHAQGQKKPVLHDPHLWAIPESIPLPDRDPAWSDSKWFKETCLLYRAPKKLSGD